MIVLSCHPHKRLDPIYKLFEEALELANLNISRRSRYWDFVFLMTVVSSQQFQRCE
jgi:hypothetical protein